MDLLRITYFVGYTVLAILAWTVARREPAHRPLAGYVAWMIGADFVRMGLTALREDAARPYTGFARLVFHVDQLIILSWTFLFLALCLHYFLRARPWPAFAAWLAVEVICIDYPLVSRDVLIGLYQSVLLGGLVASWAIILWGILRERTLAPTSAHLVIVLYACTDVVQNLVPLGRGMLTHWPMARFANLLLIGTCIVIHILRLRARPTVVPA